MEGEGQDSEVAGLLFTQDVGHYAVDVPFGDLLEVCLEGTKIDALWECQTKINLEKYLCDFVIPRLQFRPSTRVHQRRGRDLAFCNDETLLYIQQRIYRYLYSGLYTIIA